jgi:uncharacterized protein YwgA
VTLESDELEELTGEIRKLIESNRIFLERVSDEAYDDLDEDENEGEQAGESEAESDDYEEL